ncbi:unnamed protein product [Ambrosiozyma monospora]|uniref:Unnamed protein product n=1 Tax=Ambrosiozyma monospora TaxID=43982 RepID=A0ACB5TB76_AMBMO|nr:unnamed protein product [Ambrosiozyma monospora]
MNSIVSEYLVFDKFRSIICEKYSREELTKLSNMELSISPELKLGLKQFVSDTFWRSCQVNWSMLLSLQGV